MLQFPDIIELNVGGSFYTTTLLTLTKGKDNMLSAMFSGNYSAVKDKDGRFFIDADGSNFIHILNYLRYGHLPSPDLAEIVYKEAVYFGIQELVEQLEKYPAILNKIQRNSFRTNFPGYPECIDLITTLISETHTKTTTTEVRVLVYADEKGENNRQVPEGYNFNHICMYSSIFTTKTFTADVKLGPWKVDMSERDVMGCILFDLESQGFVVTLSHIGDCDYKVGQKSCHKQFYKLTIHWWKSPE